MARKAPLPPLFSLQLQPGRKVWEHLPRAAIITVTEGSIVVHQRRWLADTWVGVPVTVRAGEDLPMDAGGWVQMEAMKAAQVRVHVAPAWWTRGWVGQTLRRMRPTAVATLQSTA